MSVVRRRPRRVVVRVSKLTRSNSIAATLLNAAVAAIVFFLTAACGGNPSVPESDDDVVAVFTGGRIFRAELDAAPRVGVDAAGEADDVLVGDWRVRTIEHLTAHKVLAASVAEDDPEFLDRRRPAVDGVLHSAMVSRLGWDSIQLTEDELEAYYNANPAKFKEPEKLRMQHVFLRADSDELSPARRSEVRSRLEEIRRTVLDGADFTAMARQHSESDTAPAGGWMTLAADARVFRSFTDAVWDLEIGGISEVIDTPHGFHVVVLRERRPSFDRQFEDVREFVAKRAREARLLELQKAVIADAGPRYHLARHYERLEDPLINGSDALFEMDGDSFTFDDLVNEISAPYLEHLYTGFFPKVIEFLDLAAVNRLLVAEAHRLDLIEDPVIEFGVNVRLDELKYEIGLDRRLETLAAAVPKGELSGYFWQNRDRYQTLRNVDLSLIQLRPADGEEFWSVLKRGEELVEKINAGEDMARLARAHSRHYSTNDGGRMLGLTDQIMARKVQSTAKFRRLLAALADGEHSEPFFSECYNPGPLGFEVTGVMIVRLDRTNLPRQLEFEEAEDMARAQYRRRFHSRLAEEVAATVIDEVDLTIDLETLPPL